MNIPAKIAINTSTQIVGKIATALSTIIVTILITANFSEGDFGSYTAILSYIALFYVFTDFGFNAVFVREVGEKAERQKEYFKNLLGLRLITSLAISFLAVAILVFTNHTTLVKLGILVSLGIIFAQALTATGLAVFQSKVRFDQAAIADVFGALANVIFVYLAATFFDSILFILAALVAGNLIRAGVSLYLAKFQVGALSFGFDRSFLTNFFIAALPIGLISVFSQINMQIDKQIVFLADYDPSLNLNGERAAGLYGLAYKTFELAIVFPAFVINVGYPLMVEKKQEGLSALVVFSKKLGLLLFALGLGAVIIGWFLLPFVVEILGQGKFEESVTTARILFLGFPLFFVTPITLWLAVTLNKLTPLLFIYGFAALFNFVTNMVFVPQFGYNSAAVITLVTEVMVFSLTLGVLFISLKSR